MSDNISDKDKKDWINFVNSNEKLQNKDLIRVNKKKFQVRSIDLHGHSLDEANKVIENFIKQAFLDNISKLIVVTGKGIHSDNEKNPFVSKDLSILKYSVPEFIRSNENLMNIINDIQSARKEDGGDGAFYIILKKNNKNINLS